MGTPIRIKRSAVPGKIPAQGALQYGELAYNINDAELYAVRNRVGIGSEVIRVGAGATVTNVIYVTKDGSDTNTGLKLGDAKRTIAGAVAISTTGSVIKVAAGYYLENNPIKLPPQVSIVGDSLREVSITPQNPGDLFHVAPGNYITEVSFTGASTGGGAIVAFDPDTLRYFSQSPYIRNCTNFIPDSIGMKIDGNHALGPLKSMVTDSFTQYNSAGVGVSITNEGYAQLVSLFTICPNIAVYCASGGACDLTNSNASFGNFGLVSDGVGQRKYTGILSTSSDVNADTFRVAFNNPTFNVTNATYSNTTGIVTITTNNEHGFEVGVGVSISGLQFTCPSGPGIVTYPSGNNGYVFTVLSTPTTYTFSVNVGTSTLPHTYNSGGTAKINIIRPFDGQVIYFDTLYYTVGKIIVGSGGTGYLTTPTVTIGDPSTVSTWGVAAQAVAEISGGSVTDFEIISSGRGYTSIPTITISTPDVGINTATATIELTPSYYTIQRSTPVSAGVCTITTNENVPYVVGAGVSIPFFKQSRILASGHSFEYIGSGTDITTALPFAGGVPIQDNEVDMKNGGLVVYTSTDQSGNFRIGEGVTINQTTGTISGTFYSKSLFSTMTPFILALGGD
jgi:hypothetical protein